VIYLIFSILGVFIGSISNAFENIKEYRRPLFKWYTKFFVGKTEYILVNLIMAIIFNLLLLNYGLSLKLFTYISLCSILCIASVIDIKNQKIPNPLIIAAASLGLGSTLFYPNLNSIIDSILGAISAILLLGLIFITSHNSIGIGDIKLLMCVGIFLGMQSTLESIIISIFICGLVSFILMKLHFLNRKSNIPFAPFVFLGVLLTIITI
jgi:prepilin signal peptidase PulO-like enzyme (type II secretory pathway)